MWPTTNNPKNPLSYTGRISHVEEPVSEQSSRVCEASDAANPSPWPGPGQYQGRRLGHPGHPIAGWLLNGKSHRKSEKSDIKMGHQDMDDLGAQGPGKLRWDHGTRGLNHCIQIPPSNNWDFASNNWDAHGRSMNMLGWPTKSWEFFTKKNTDM